MLSEMEAVIRTHPTKIAQGQMDSVENSIRILQEELAPILFKLSHKIETGEQLLIFYMTTITPIAKLHKHTKELQINIGYKHRSRYFH